MRISRPLMKLPVRFCAETLQREIAQLPPDAWTEHPQKFDGNIAVALVSPGGAITNGAAGPMGPTQWLRQCTYILEIMQALACTWGRSRLMGLQAEAEVPEHVDVHYYWRTHLRLHIPIITNPDVAFTCAGEKIHMAPGECWLLDSFHRHSVVNGGTETRIHLVLDTVGSGRLWDLIDAATSGTAKEYFLEPGSAQPGPIDFEQINSPLIMSPWEIKTHITYIFDWTDEQPGREGILRLVNRFVMAWEASWACYGVSEEGLPHYVTLVEELNRALGSVAVKVMMRNNFSLQNAIRQFILANAIAPSLLESWAAKSATSQRVAQAG